MFRREWRQQVVVTALLTTAVAAAVGFGIAGYNLAGVPANGEFGTASHFIRLRATDAASMESDVAAARELFGVIDVIANEQVAVPGRFEEVDYRSQDPSGAFGWPMLALSDGRYPGPAEAAVTDGVAADFGLRIGSTVSLDGTARKVVGLVENPNDLDDEFVLIAPGDSGAIDSVTILLDSDEAHVEAYRPPGGGDRTIGARGSPNESVFAAVGVLGITAIALVMVGLLAAAGFTVVAQRRRRQLGMLAAMGATERHLRLAMVANGVAVGGVASGSGAVLGIVGWIAAQPWLEGAAGYRVARFDLPWWLIGAIVLLATSAASAAAWWPARAASRGSIVHALSGRPSPPRAVHRSAIVAGMLVASGLVALISSGDLADDRTVHWVDVSLVLCGTVLTIVGILLACPLAVRALGSQAGRLGIAPKLALRDLARFQSRSGAALATITLVLGIPTAIVVAASAAQHDGRSGNLAATQVVVHTNGFDGPFIPEEARLAELGDVVKEVAGSFGVAHVIALDVAVDPDLANTTSFDGRLAASLGARVEGGWADLSLAYVAQPDLLAIYGLGISDIDPNAEVVTTEVGELAILGVAGGPVQEEDATDGGPAKEPSSGGTSERRRAPQRAAAQPVTAVASIEATYTSVPGTFLTETGLVALGLEATGSGRWLVELSGPPTGDQLSKARSIAAAKGLTIETRDYQEGLSRLRSGATAVGVLLALGVLAMTVGLIRNETAGDMQKLTAAGATSTIRRAITATTAAALAGLGVVLGSTAALAVLFAGYLGPGAVARLPIAHLMLIIIGTPVIAGLAGWVFAGEDPPALSRQPMT